MAQTSKGNSIARVMEFVTGRIMKRLCIYNALAMHSWPHLYTCCFRPPFVFIIKIHQSTLEGWWIDLPWPMRSLPLNRCLFPRSSGLRSVWKTKKPPNETLNVKMRIEKSCFGIFQLKNIIVPWASNNSTMCEHKMANINSKNRTLMITQTWLQTAVAMEVQRLLYIIKYP